MHPGLARQLLHRLDVALGQVHHVDVVAHPGAVHRGVVLPVHVQVLQFAHRHLGDVGDQVVGDALGVLPDAAALVGADGVEVAEDHQGEAGVGPVEVPQNLLGHQLGGAVGVGHREGEILSDGDGGRRAVHRGGGGEHQGKDLVLLHQLEQVQGAGQVVVVVFQRFLHRLPHRLEPGEVDDPVELVGAKDRLGGGVVQQVDLAERHLFAGDLLNALHHFGAGVAEVVQDHHLVSRVQQFHAGVASDVTGAAGDQQFHKMSFFPFHPVLADGKLPIL